jgi:hypothetical protein
MEMYLKDLFSFENAKKNSSSGRVKKKTLAGVSIGKGTYDYEG